MTKEERKKKALELKGDHKLYFCKYFEPYLGIIGWSAIIADLSDCVNIDNDWMYPDYNPPRWVFEILEIFGCDFIEDSRFEFQDEEIMNEVKEVCDIVEDLSNKNSPFKRIVETTSFWI